MKRLPSLKLTESSEYKGARGFKSGIRSFGRRVAHVPPSSSFASYLSLPFRLSVLLSLWLSRFLEKNDAQEEDRRRSTGLRVIAGLLFARLSEGE